MKPTLLFVLICVLPASVSAQGVESLNRTAESSIKVTRDKDGKPVLTTINRRFTLVDSARPVLLLEEFRHDLEASHEQPRGVVKVDAFRHPDLNKKIWSIEQSGDEGRVSDELYVVTKYGCCMAITTSVYFNLDNGERIFGKSDKSSFSDFAIVLSMFSAGEIVVPVSNDKPDLTKVTMPPQFRIELLK